MNADRIASKLHPEDSKSRRILLIEDNPVVVTIIERILHSAGHKTRSSTHGKDLTQLVELFSPELIITDIIMSEIDTIDAIMNLRRDHSEITIVAISGNRHLLTLAAKYGADYVLQKPFSPHRLRDLVNTALL